MDTTVDTQLTSCLARVAGHIKHLRRLDPSMGAELEQALATCQQVMGALAMYRGLLQRMEERAAWPLRRAA